MDEHDLARVFLRDRRFDDLLRQTGMSLNLLSRCLKKLEDLGVTRREAYSDHPPRYEYRLTEMGRDLWPVIIAMKQWGNRWLVEGKGSIQIVHKGCEHVAQPQMTCSRGGDVMQARDASFRLSRALKRERRSAGNAS